MKRYKFLLLAVVAALVTGCYGDDTNLDYKTLDLPAIDNPENDPALFIPNRAYKVKLHDRLQITPNVVYKDMNDLSYKWIIDGQLYSTTKDLDWLCGYCSGVHFIGNRPCGVGSKTTGLRYSHSYKKTCLSVKLIKSSPPLPQTTKEPARKSVCP